MISEKSCDTSNDAEDSALHHRNKLHLTYIQIENSYVLKKKTNTFYILNIIFLLALINQENQK